MTDDQEEARTVPKWIGIVGLFVAPTTVITALCYFYGYVATRTYFSYFGIDTDAIGFTTTDYVMKSVPTLYVPLVVGLLSWVAMLWAVVGVRRLIQSGRRPRLVCWLGLAAAIVGVVGVARAIIGLTKPEWALIHADVVTPVTLGLGSALLVVGFWMLAGRRARDELRPFAAAQRTSLVVAAAAIVAAIFWITDIFATARGLDQAEITYSKLWSRESSVILDTDARQNLPVPPEQIKVTWAPPADPAAKPTFLRYQCFRSLAVHGDRWVLVPARWSPEYGYAVIVTADSSHLISMMKIKDIADSDAAKRRDGSWECPEVGIGPQNK